MFILSRFAGQDEDSLPPASAQRKADRNGQVEFRLRHGRREGRQRLRAVDHRHDLVVEIGMTGATHDVTREHVAGAIDAEAEKHDPFIAVRLRLARIALVLLQVPHQPGLPR